MQGDLARDLRLSWWALEDSNLRPLACKARTGIPRYQRVSQNPLVRALTVVTCINPYRSLLFLLRHVCGAPAVCGVMFAVVAKRECRHASILPGRSMRAHLRGSLIVSTDGETLLLTQAIALAAAEQRCKRADVEAMLTSAKEIVAALEKVVH